MNNQLQKAFIRIENIVNNSLNNKEVQNAILNNMAEMQTEINRILDENRRMQSYLTNYETKLRVCKNTIHLLKGMQKGLLEEIED